MNDHFYYMLLDSDQGIRYDIAMEYASGQYLKLSDCPSYKAARDYCKILNLAAPYAGIHQKFTIRDFLQGGAYCVVDFGGGSDGM